MGVNLTSLGGSRWSCSWMILWMCRRAAVIRVCRRGVRYLAAVQGPQPVGVAIDGESLIPTAVATAGAVAAPLSMPGHMARTALERKCRRGKKITEAANCRVSFNVEEAFSVVEIYLTQTYHFPTPPRSIYYVHNALMTTTTIYNKATSSARGLAQAWCRSSSRFRSSRSGASNALT